MGGWHLSDDGPRPCTAAVRPCPLGDVQPPFSNRDDAQRAYDKKMDMEYQPILFGKISKKEPMAQKDTIDLPPYLRERGLHEQQVLDRASAEKRPLTDEEYETHLQYVDETIDWLVKSGYTTDVTETNSAGIYKRERTVIQQQILSELVDKALAGGVHYDRKMIMSGGMGGAGKGYVLSGFAGVKQSEYLTVNPDDLKEELAKKGYTPKVMGLTPMETSALIHEECSFMSKQLSRMAQARGMNVIMDTTMSSERSAESKIDEYKEQGYTVQAIFVDVSSTTSTTRGASRHRIGMDEYTTGKNRIGGRHLPHTVNAAAPDNPRFRSKNAEVFATLAKRRKFSAVKIYRNDNSPERVKWDEFAG